MLKLMGVGTWGNRLTVEDLWAHRSFQVTHNTHCVYKKISIDLLSGPSYAYTRCVYKKNMLSGPPATFNCGMMISV
jgi:hypothetical protein